jgi:hypothetical protein
MNWLVQNNLIKETLIEDMESACKALGHHFIGLKIIPFTDSVEFGFPPGFEMPKGKLIPYGSTSMIKMIGRSNLDKSGFFFNQENLRTSKWVEKLGKRMLNHDAQVMSLKDAMDLKEGFYFMKPDNDLKDFSGCLVNAGGIKKFYDQVSAGGFTFSTDIQVVLSEPKDTGWEWRFFMIGDRIISCSSYKLRDMLNQTKAVGHNVKDFAVETARTWHPDEVYVMDICEADEGLKVVEFNCFNASGFYACDVREVVEQVSKFVSLK